MQPDNGPLDQSSQHPLPKHVPAQSDAHNSPVRRAEGNLPSRVQQTPQPIEGTTPESLPSDGMQSADSAELRDMDLFQQLGPRPMQSLAAGDLQPRSAGALQASSRAAQAQSMQGDTTTAMSGAAEAAASASSLLLADAAAYGGGAKSNDGDMTGARKVPQRGVSMSGYGNRQAKQNLPPTLPVVPEASAEAGHGPAEDRRRTGALRRSLLPAVHPRFRSSPLRTPAVAQSLGTLPDQATGHETGPGSSGVRIGSSWDCSARQGSLQRRLQQAAVSRQGRLPAHANSGTLPQHLQQAALALQTSTVLPQQELSREEHASSRLGDGKASASRPSKHAQQKRSAVLPSRPSGKGRTPTLSSAHGAPMLDMQSVSA